MKIPTLVMLFHSGLFMVANGAIIFTEVFDFSESVFSPFILPTPLGIGANTITGSLPVDFPFADVDVFNVNNPSGFTLSSLTINITNFVPTTTSPGDGLGILRLEAPGFSQMSVSGNGLFSLVAIPSNASVFQFRFIGPDDFTYTEVGSMNYLVTLNAIPEPATAGLLFGALALAAGTLRRRA